MGQRESVMSFFFQSILPRSSSQQENVEEIQKRISSPSLGNPTISGCFFCATSFHSLRVSSGSSLAVVGPMAQQLLAKQDKRAQSELLRR